MIRRFFPIFLLSLALNASAQNYADTLLDSLTSRVEALGDKQSPIERLLLAEDIYYLSHESARQNHIADLLKKLYDSSSHGETTANIGFFLTQHLRQLGREDEVAELVKSLGYVPEWQVLGPLGQNRNLDLKKTLQARSVKGLDRDVSPFKLRAWGEQDHWSAGIGQYGFFSANSGIYPNQLAGALYSTWFYAPAKGNYRLGLGFGYYTKAWVNRTKVFEAEGQQDAHPDQGVVFFEARKGWNRVSVYIESQSEEPNLGFFARLTDEKGTPLQIEARATRKLPGKKVRIINGEKPLLNLAEDHSAYALASVLLLLEHQFHEQYGKPKDRLTSAFNENPTREVTDKLLSLTTDANERLQYLRTLLDAIGDAPDKNLDRAWAYTELGQLALDQKRFWEARNNAERAKKEAPDFWPAQVLLNNTFSALGLHGEALREARELASGLPDVPWLMMDLSDLYAALGFRKESEAYTDRVLTIRRNNGKFAERKINQLKRRGDVEELDKLYAAIVRDTPYSATLILNYAQFLMANNKLEEADSLLASAINQLPENPFLLEGMGELRSLQSSPDAMSFFERSLALRPQNPQLEKRLALSRSEAAIAFYDEYRLEPPRSVPLLEVTPIVINLDNTVVKVAPNGQSSTYHQKEWEVLEEQGLEELPGYSFSYAPLRQNADVIKAEIIRGEQTIPLTRYGRSRISDPAYRMYYDLVAWQIPFLGLEVGDKVRVEYRIDDVDSTNIYGDYFGDLQYFSDSYPIRRKSYTLIIPEDRKIYKHVERMEPQFKEDAVDGNRVYTWTMEGLSSYETESRMPGLAGYLPYVAISTFANWQEMAKWYKELIASQLLLDMQTKQIVRELTEGVTDRLEIVKKVHEYVVTNTRYVALEFGIHGYKPYQVNQVCSRQFGDCKDKASLIVAMLREAGVDANIVITRTSDRGDIHDYPAMLSYFNHAIAHIPEFDLFLDGTAEYSGISELPEMDQGALVLIVDKDGNGTLTHTPILSNNYQKYTFNLDLDTTGAANISGEMFYEGVITPELRQYLSIDSKLSDNVRELLGNMMPGIDVKEADRTGRGINENITLKFKGISRGLVQKNDGKLRLPLNLLAGELVNTYAPNAQRRFPMDLGPPKTRSIDLLVEAPQGYTLAEAPEPLDIEDDNLHIKLNVVEESESTYRLSYKISFKTNRIEPDQYPSLRNLMQKHDRAIDQSINFIAR